MKIKNALLLSAGLGTRMGQIGKIIPKPIWPFFDKTLLDLQIQYLEGIGIEHIYINTHYLAEEINRYLKKSRYKNITIMHEDELLKIGGSIHYLIKEKKLTNTKLLVVNADQFYFPDKSTLDEAINRSDTYTAVLFTLRCKPGNNYNELVLKENLLKRISIANPGAGRDYVTFSGTSIVNTSMLKHHPGKSDYFETVANYKSEKVYVMDANNYLYYDFGTIMRYYNSCFKIYKEYKNNTNLFIKHINMPEFINMFQKQNENVLNFTKNDFINLNNYKSIIMSSNELIEITTPGLYFNNIIEQV